MATRLRGPGRWLGILTTAMLAAWRCATPHPSPAAGASAAAGGASEPPAASASAPAAQRGGTINYITFAEPLTLNPRMLPEGIAFQVGELVSRGLSEFDNTGKVYAE